MINKCTLPPKGWYCSRESGHKGPCAARPEEINLMPSELREEVRIALADYMRTEGCSCCQDRTGHEAAAERLAKLLKVPKYSDGSGYDFQKFRKETK